MQTASKAGTQRTQPPRIAVIGCGAIAELFYLPTLVKQPGITENLILIDRDEGRARKLGQKFDVKQYAVDYHEALKTAVDGAIIALPTHLHYAAAKACLANRVHILCEKPLTETGQEARELVSEAQTSRVALAVNYMRRLLPTYKKVKDILQSGELGEPRFIKYWEGEKFRWPTATGFRFDRKLSPRGVLLDRGSHIFDLICWWLGAKPQITLSKNDSFGGPEAVAEVHFSYNQCYGEVKLSLLGKFPSGFVVRCQNGSVQGDVNDFRTIELISRSGTRNEIRLPSPEKLYFDFGDAIVTNFIAVITHGRQPLLSGKDVLDSMNCLDESYARATRFELPWYEPGAMADGT